MLLRHDKAYCSIIRQLLGMLRLSDKVKEVVLNNHTDVRQQTMTLEEVDSMLDTCALYVLAPEPDKNGLAANREGVEWVELRLHMGAPSSTDEEVDGHN